MYKHGKSVELTGKKVALNVNAPGERFDMKQTIRTLVDVSRIHKYPLEGVRNSCLSTYLSLLPVCACVCLLLLLLPSEFACLVQLILPFYACCVCV